MSLFLYQITGRHGDTGVVIADTEEDAIQICRKKYLKEDYPLMNEANFYETDDFLLVSELDDNEVPGLYIITKG